MSLEIGEVTDQRLQGGDSLPGRPTECGARWSRLHVGSVHAAPGGPVRHSTGHLASLGSGLPSLKNRYLDSMPGNIIQQLKKKKGKIQRNVKCRSPKQRRQGERLCDSNSAIPGKARLCRPQGDGWPPAVGAGGWGGIRRAQTMFREYGLCDPLMVDTCDPFVQTHRTGSTKSKT